MRRGQAAEDDEILVGTETFAQPLRLRHPQPAETRPGRLDELHLVAMLDHPPAQPVEVFRGGVFPGFGPRPPRPPVVTGQRAGEVTEHEVVERPGINGPRGLGQRLLQFAPPERRQGGLGRLLRRLDAAAHGLERRCRKPGLFKVGKRIERCLQVARRRQRACEIARLDSQLRVLGRQERLDEAQVSAPALHRLAIIVHRGGIAAIGRKRGAALADDLVRDRRQGRTDRLARPQRWLLPHGGLI
jgi:hypothetical protein